MTVGDGVVQITWTKVFILVAALVGMLTLTWIIQYTRLGASVALPSRTGVWRQS